MRKSTMFRIGTAVGFAAILAIAIAACGSSGDSSSSASGTTSESGAGAKTTAANTETKTTPEPGTTYTVGIDIPFHPIFDFVHAEADKYFANKPYKVNFKILDATTQVPSFGKGDLSVMTTPPSFIPRLEDTYGIKAQEFFPLARWTTGAQIVVPADSPYKTLDELKGKSVAIAPLNTLFGEQEAAILGATGETIQDYFDLKETPSAPQELSLGRVEAAYLEAPTVYPLLKSGKFKSIYTDHEAFLKAFGDPAVVNGGYIARTEFLEDPENQDFVETLVRSTQDAWDRFNTEEKHVNEVAAKVSGVPVEGLKLVGEVLDLNGIPESERAITPKDVKTWEQIFPLLAESGFIKEAPSEPATLFRITK
jgi:ABC-type nitrate/sulfonate/bicarbonate transport system substrate-binding protein